MTQDQLDTEGGNQEADHEMPPELRGMLTDLLEEDLEGSGSQPQEAKEADRAEGPPPIGGKSVFATSFDSHFDEAEEDPEKTRDQAEPEEGFGAGEFNKVQTDPTNGILPGPRNTEEKVVRHYAKIRTVVFDLAKPEDAAAYSKEIETICHPKSKRIVVMEDAPPVIILDPNAPLGYRAIIVLRTGDVAEAAVKRERIDVVDRRKLKRSGPKSVDSTRPEGDA